MADYPVFNIPTLQVVDHDEFTSLRPSLCTVNQEKKWNSKNMFKTLKVVTKLIISQHDANSYINKQVFFNRATIIVRVVQKSMESKTKKY